MLTPEIDLEAAIAALKQHAPGLWERCYPRIYHAPKTGKYCSPKMVSLLLAKTTLAYMERKLFGGGEEGTDYEFMVACHLVKHRMPLYWISEGFGEAIGKTKWNLPLDWWNMPLLVDAGVFVLPEGMLKDPEEGNVLFLAWGKMQPGVEYKSPFVEGARYVMHNGGMTFLAFLESGYLLHWNLPLDLTPKMVMLEQLCNDSAPQHSKLQQTESNRRLIVEVARFVFMTSMVLADRPHLLTPGALQKRVQHKGEAPREFWTPNILGRDYKIKTEEAPVGEHRSPRLHLVHGFMREQSHGPKHSLRRPMWIEPFWRGSL